MPMILRQLIFILLVLLAGCQKEDTPLPTLAQPNAVATDIVLTRNAPPPGFDSVSFPMIDDNLTLLPGWRYEMSLSFAGIYARTPRDAVAHASAEVQFNQFTSAQRIVAQISNEQQERNYEAVRLGQKVYLVQDGSCSSNANEAAELAVSLSAGSLLGGVEQADTAAQQETINGSHVWRYTFDVDSVNLPILDFGEAGRIAGAAGELWVAPEYQAVVRYYLNLDVENVSLTLLDSDLPVSGTLQIRYNLYDIGDAPNLTVPFGC